MIDFELRADVTNSEGEPRLEEIDFSGIPKFVCLLLGKRESIYDGHEASVGEANLLVASCCFGHLDENVLVFNSVVIAV